MAAGVKSWVVQVPRILSATGPLPGIRFVTESGGEIKAASLNSLGLEWLWSSPGWFESPEIYTLFEVNGMVILNCDLF